jgi:hypothetical protein
MSISLRGHKLNQRQINACANSLDELIQGRLKQSDFEDSCMAALEAAGCPIGYDASLDPSKTIEQRASNWIVNGEVGLSSQAIWAHMMGIEDKGHFSHPHDPDDLNRCLLLLDLIPEWRPRMPEMAVRGPYWEALTACWQEIESSFLAEVGLGWSKGKKAPETYALMNSAYRVARG